MLSGAKVAFMRGLEPFPDRTDLAVTKGFMTAQEKAQGF